MPNDDGAARRRKGRRWGRFARHWPPRLRSHDDGGLHPRRPDQAHRAAWTDSRLRGMPQDWQLVGPPADVPDLRPDRLLRFLAKPPRQPARPPGQPSHRSLGGTRRGLELVLRRSARLRHRHPRPRTRRFSTSVTRIGAAIAAQPSRAPVGRLGADQDHPSPVGADRRQGGAGHDRAAQPLVERAPVPGRARLDDPTAAPCQVSFQIDFDFVDHRLLVRTNRGQQGSFRLHEGLSVAGFDRLRLHWRWRELGSLHGVLRTPHAAYDPDSVLRYWQVLDWVDTVLEEFSGWYCGKQSPVHLFWHSLDLAITRFSGRRAPPRAGADPVTHEAYSHEVISFGFWAGDDNTHGPAFYFYTAPELAGLTDQPLHPASAVWRRAPKRVDGAARLRPAPRRRGPR